MSTNEALIQYWYARLPANLAPLVPRFAAAVGDGGWTSAWSRIAAWAPVLVFGIGVFVPRTWPGTQVVYTESPLFLALAAALSILSGTLGAALFLANGLREALSHDMASTLNAVAHVGAGQVVVWLLLGVLVVLLPQLAHLLTEAGVVRMRFLRNRDVRAVCRPALLVDEANRRLDAAVQEARASAEADVARIISEADERLAAAVHEARAAGAAKLADVQREAERLLAARVAQERAEAVPKAQASAPARKQTLEEHLEEARAQVARYRKSAV